MFFRIGRVLALTAGLCIFSFLVFGRHLGLGLADDRVRLSGNHSLLAEAFSPLGNAALDAPLRMQIRFALRDQAALVQLLVDQQNPASKNFHKWLKTGEFSRRFGPASSEVKAVEQWLEAQGFMITSRAPGYLGFSGNVAQTQNTFDVRIARFGDGSAYGNTADPVVPRQLADVIGAIVGMDNMVRAVPQFRRVSRSSTGYETVAPARGKLSTPSAPDRSAANSAAPQYLIGNFQAFGPGDMRSFYGQTVGAGRDGSGDCIAIVGTSDFFDATASTFTSQFGLPPISYTRVLHGPNPGILPDDSLEAELDLQWTHAAAPGASIVFHYGSDLIAAISGAVSDNTCGAINISFALCGPSQSLITNTVHGLFLQAAAQGQSVFVSSGDQGAAGLSVSGDLCIDSFSRSVNELSADPNVTSVGGTQFNPTFFGGNNTGHVPEDVWDDASGATGGGASEFFAKPGYQTGAGVPDDGARDVPDISLIASPNSPGVFWADETSGGPKVICCLGGTSLSAPLWAGYSRVIAQLSGTTRLGNLNPMIYDLANTQTKFNFLGFRDVTIGDNHFNGVAGFSAGSGYDQSTGWGTIDFDTFATAATNWIASHPASTATASPTRTATATVTRTATATATTTATPTITATSTPTVTATATRTTTATPTLTATSTPTSTQTATVTLTPTATLTTTPTLTATATPSATLTSAATPTPTSTTIATSTPTNTPAPTLTATITPTPTATPTPISEPTGGILAVPATLHFPATGVGIPTAPRRLLIRNRSKTTPLSVDVGTLDSPFSVSGAGHYMIAPASSVTVMIGLDPSTVGIANRLLPISSGDPKRLEANVTITGKVLAGRLSAPHQVTFTTKAGAAASKTVILKNVGRGMLSGTVELFDPGSPFELVDGPVKFSLAPGEKQPVTIKFNGAGAGRVTANLAIGTTPPPATTTVVVTGAAH